MPQSPDFHDVGCATGNDERTKQQENPVEGHISPLDNRNTLALAGLNNKPVLSRHLRQYVTLLTQASTDSSVRGE